MAYPTTNKKVIAFVEESAKLACPDQIVWIDGSEAQLEALRKEACETGEIIKLNQEKLPAAIITAPPRTTSPASKRARSSAARIRTTRVPTTTGWTPRKRMQCARRSRAAR